MSRPSHSFLPREPLIAHVIHRFAMGGTENGMVNLINGLDANEFRHAVIALTEVDPAFARRILRKDTEFIELHKPPGHGFRAYGSLYRTFRSLRPAIVHTRNLAALEAALPAWLAGVPVRIHGEHGWDINDPGGTNRRYRFVRRVYKPFVTRYVAVSNALVSYLHSLGVPARSIEHIYNGVDLARYQPNRSRGPRLADAPAWLDDPANVLIGTVGRMQAVKDQCTLARAFASMLEREPVLRDRARLVIIGDGPLRAQCEEILSAANALDIAWLPGSRDDVADVMRRLDIFVLPSVAEGISNTILEAMASGLPVVATAVGGNPELVEHDRAGFLVPSGNVDAMASVLERLARDGELRRESGRQARLRAEREFGLDSMVARYRSLYREALARTTPASRRYLAAGPTQH